MKKSIKLLCLQFQKQPVVTDDDEAFATLHLNRKISSAPTVEIERPSQINRKQDKKKVTLLLR